MSRKLEHGPRHYSIQDNQTSLRFECIPPAINDYLFLQDENNNKYDNKDDNEVN